MEQLIDFHAPEVQAVLDTLLKDRSTGKNIIWATDPPEELQTVMYEPVTDRSQITTQQLGLTHYEVVLPRMMKQTDTQQQRTRKRRGVQPRMGLQQDEQRTGCRLVRCAGGRRDRRAVHGGAAPRLADDGNAGAVSGLQGQDPGMGAVCAEPPLEVTCGEAPFLASRYDAATGEMIPVARRIGILDRKLRVVSENAATEEEWRKYATHAVQSTYGYEYQGDNLFVGAGQPAADLCRASASPLAAQTHKRRVTAYRHHHKLEPVADGRPAPVRARRQAPAGDRTA